MSIQIQIGADVSGLNKAIGDASKSLNGLKAPAANAQNALFSLTQVTRDLPFGFIAIQNNLPLVFDSFANLSKEAGGLSGGLKALGASLIGPAGIAFAISATISGVTALIQKYGSLGEAFDAIILGNSKFIETQKTINKAIAETSGNVAVEEAKIKILVNTIKDLDAPQKNRLDAYNELKKISPDVVAGIRDENALTQQSISLINSNAEARLKLLKLKIQEAGVTSILTKNAEELATLQQQLNVENQNYVATAKALQESQKQTNVTGIAAVNVQQAAFSAFKSSASTVSELQKRIAELNKEQESYLNQLKPIVQQTSSINAATQIRVDNIKKEDKALKDALKTKKEIIKFDEILRTALIKPIPLNESLNKRLDNSSKGLEEFRKDIFGLPNEIKTPKININPLLSQSQKDLSLLAQNYEAVKTNLENVFFNPLSDLFENFFNNGKFTFQDFAKTILSVVKKLVAQLIATGIIKLLTSILVPGGAAASAATKGVTGGGIFGGIIKGITSIFGGGNIAAPQFGGVQGGGFGLSGQVVFRQSGSDLVGVLNRTNATINRVG